MIFLIMKEKVDLVFYPRPAMMYAPDFSTYVEESYLSRALCGKFRPGHFKGVTTVVAKLFNIIEPDITYFGQKDYQQALIIKRLIRDLNLPITIKVMPIVRDRRGLALSSRNMYLHGQEKKDALVLSESLRLAKKLIKEGERNPSVIKRKMRKLIHSKKTTKIQYIEIADQQTLRPLGKINDKALCALAVFVGRARLIDNTIL